MSNGDGDGDGDGDGEAGGGAQCGERGVNPAHCGVAQSADAHCFIALATSTSASTRSGFEAGTWRWTWWLSLDRVRPVEKCMKDKLIYYGGTPVKNRMKLVT